MGMGIRAGDFLCTPSNFSEVTTPVKKVSRFLVVIDNNSSNGKILGRRECEPQQLVGPLFWYYSS